MCLARRNTLCLFILILLLLPLSGCIMNPIYYLKDLIKLSGIEGSWISGNSPENASFDNWDISPTDSGRYLIVHNTDGPDQYYLAGFLKLKGTLYADVADIRINQSRYDAATKHATYKYDVGTHNVMKIALQGDTLSVRMMDLDYLDKCLSTKKYKLPYRIYTDHSSDYNTGSTIYVTASTAELQTFLKTYSDDPKLFSPAMFFYREDPAFNGYFPKEAWEMLPLLSRPDVPELLKQSQRGTEAIKKVGLHIIDSLEQAQKIYKPFYFQAASTNIMQGADSLTAARYTRYVLEHTNEFLHFFTSYNRIASNAMFYWTKTIRDGGESNNTLDATVSQLKAFCNNCSAKEKQVLHNFVQSIKPDRDAYRSAAEKNQTSDDISIIEVEATPVKVSPIGDPIQIVHPSGDSIYLLTSRPYNDTVLAKVTHAINLETPEPQPVTEQLQLDPRGWKGYVMRHGQISSLNSIDPILIPTKSGNDPESANNRNKLTITHWAVRDEQPVCNAFKYIPGEQPNKYYLINYCSDSNKVIATNQTYTPATFRRYMRHHCIPVNYTDAAGDTYTVVVTKSVGDGEQPLAHVLVSHKNKLMVYRVWIKGGNKRASSLYCFAQNGYCYLYDRWNGGTGEKDTYLYKFPLTGR